MDRARVASRRGGEVAGGAGGCGCGLGCAGAGPSDPIEGCWGISLRLGLGLGPGRGGGESAGWDHGRVWEMGVCRLCLRPSRVCWPGLALAGGGVTGGGGRGEGLE